MNEVNIQDTMLVAIIIAIIPELLKINWKKLDDLNFSFNECIIINGKYKYTTETKKTVNESRSFASKPTGNAPKKPIVESNDFVSRMQKLAGII